MPVYVIGHRNPDTDAICSAIGYAHLLSAKGLDAVPARCGEVNARTTFALEEAGVNPPRLLMDVRPTAGTICRRNIIRADAGDSLIRAFDRMRQEGLRSMPVLDSDRNLIGMVSLLKMLNILLPASGGNEARLVRTNLDRILDAVGGTFQNAEATSEDEEFVVTVGAMSASTFSSRLKTFAPEKVVMVTGNRPTIQRPAIEYGVRCLVVTGGYSLEESLLQQAREKGVTVIISPHDTASTTILIKSAKLVVDALLDNAIQFSEGEALESIQPKIRDSLQALFPVIGQDGRLVGVFSKSDLLNPPLTELVLVDHNEFTQAVGGIDQARILEVIDHHRLGGGFSSREPIRFINEPVGSTCTIVARMCRDAGIQLPAGIALCLATGMISDTLMLTSPTTTDVDREILPWLGEQAGRDLKEYAEAFFAAGSVLQIQTADEAVRGDCKEYEEGDWKLAVAQIEELGLDRFWDRRDELQQALEAMRKDKGVDFACLFVTDIGLHFSVLLVAGDPALCDAIDYPRIKPGVYALEGVVSRKKQLLPHLTSLFAPIQKS